MRRTERIFGSFVALLFLFVFAGVASAQNAALVGTVSDSTGAVVPGATVTLTNQANGVSSTTETDNAGSYGFAQVRPGNYSLRTEAAGFKAYLQRSIVLEVADRRRVDVTLQVGAVAETITVTEFTVGVQTESSSIGEVITTKQVEEIPLNGRFMLDLAFLVPGTVLPSSNNTSFLAGQGASGTFGINSSGGREDSANYMLDGINLNDMVQNQITFQPNIETLQEFKVQSNSFTAEYGRSSGIVINAVTKSGGNSLHGSVFEFLRNEKLDARNFFDPTREANRAATGSGIAPFKRNIFGYSVGGPVLFPGYDGRDRSFFFHAYEGRRQSESATFRATVPTAAERAAVTDPVVQQLLALVPNPNVPGATTNNFTGNASRERETDQFTFKGDHLFGANTISGTYMYQDDDRTEPSSIGNHNIPGFGDTRNATRQLFSLRYNRVFSPSVTNEFRFGFNRINITFVEEFGGGLDPNSFGLNTGFTDNFPDIRVGGGPSFGGRDAFPQGRADSTFQFTDTATWIRGSHSFKFGGEVRRFRNNNFNDAVGGRIRFATLADFLAGQPNDNSVRRGSISPGIRTTALNFFVQDDYKLAPTFTLNLGLRYEFNDTPHERFDKLTLFDPATQQLVPAAGRRIYDRDTNNFAPRVGFSWDPFGGGNTVVRGGYGIFYDQPVTNIVTGLGSNPPFATSLRFTDPDGVGVGDDIDLANPFDPFIAGQTGAATSISLSAVDPNFVSALVQQFNLNVQHERWNTVFQVGYIGSTAQSLRIRRDINQGIAGVRPNPNFTRIILEESVSRSNYNALWLSANRRLSRGLTFLASYTFSKSIDLNSVGSRIPQIQDANNLQAERALSDFDARHRVVISSVYDLPFHAASGWKKNAVEGWRLSTIINYQAGNPFSPGLTTANSGTLNTFNRPNLVPGQDPNLDNFTIERAFNTAAFAIPPAGEFGNAGRNILTAPNLKNLDVAVIKDTTIFEDVKLQFRTQFFNLFNHPSFDQPGMNANTGTFGVISSTRNSRGDIGSSRQIEFALKLLF